MLLGAVYGVWLFLFLFLLCVQLFVLGYYSPVSMKNDGNFINHRIPNWKHITTTVLSINRVSRHTLRVASVRHDSTSSTLGGSLIRMAISCRFLDIVAERGRDAEEGIANIYLELGTYMQ